MESKTVTRTVTCGMESSDEKNTVVEESCEIFREVMNHASDILPSFDESQWRPNDTTLYRVAVMNSDFTEREVAGLNNLKSSVCREAAQKVAESFSSWESNGKLGSRPEPVQSGYIRLPKDCYEVVENDGGFGFKGQFISYNTVWWHLDTGCYQNRYLRQVLDGEAEFGSAELFYNDGDPVVNITVRWDVKVLPVEDCDLLAGVDLGENAIYTVSVVDSDETVREVEIEKGAEFRHHRERIDQKRERLQRKGDLNAVRLSKEREKYTEYVTDKVSKDVVDLVSDFDSVGIVLEDLTDYREHAEDPIHDWPYNKIQEKIVYKAKENSIPVEFVDPSYTSQRCRQCGSLGDRDGVDFFCDSCGYEVHADVNGAVNIARRGFGEF